MIKRPRLLIVDDDADARRFVNTIGVRLGFEVLELADVKAFDEVLLDFSPSLIVLDLQMPEADGVSLLRQMAVSKNKAKIVLLSGCDERVLNTVQELAHAQGLSCAGVLRKPASAEAFEKVIRDAGASITEVQHQDIREALANGNLEVYYQPQITRQDGRWAIDSAEALLRWNHPTYGAIAPSTFIPIAEASGLMSLITDFVVLQVAEQMPVWRKSGLDVAVAVNLSPVCINDLELPDRLQALLREYELPGSALTMEITETRKFLDSTKCMDILSRLRMMGVGLSIDDFGTGTSSLQQLYRMPFNELKLDGSFVSKVTASEEARVIVRSTVDLAHALKMTVCAEWVESFEIFAYLETIGCDKMQGYLISEAVRAAKFGEVVDKWNSMPARRHADVVPSGRSA